MSTFKLKQITDVSQMVVGDSIPESDFSHFTNDGKFLQWEHIPDADAKNTVEVKPGIWKIHFNQMLGMHLIPTEFTKVTGALKEGNHTERVMGKIDKFLNKIHVYEKYDMFAKRAILLWGSQGTGKSFIISQSIEKYIEQEETAVIVWPTDKYKASNVKELLQDLVYINCKHLFLIIEDIGGVEAQGYGKQPVESSLLSLLDNVEKIFQIPTLIIGTTNFPETLLENLSDRPQRFDDVEHIPNPSPEFRSKFLSFFSKENVDSVALEKIKEKTYEHLSVAHIKEIVIRADIYDLTILESLEQVTKQSQKARKQFQDDKSKMGM